MRVAKELFELPADDNASLYSEDPKKSCRLYMSIDCVHEKVLFWRDTLRFHCHPLDDYVEDWPRNPARYRYVCVVAKDNSMFASATRSSNLKVYDNLGAQPGVQRPPPNPQPNPFGNAFVGAGSGHIRGGLGAYGERILGSSSEYVQSNSSDILWLWNSTLPLWLVCVCVRKDVECMYFSDPKYYFQVNDHYVRNKLQVALFPFLQWPLDKDIRVPEWTCLCMGIYLVKTMKRVLFAEVRTYDLSRHYYLLLFIVLAQFPLFNWVGNVSVNCLFKIILSSCSSGEVKIWESDSTDPWVPRQYITEQSTRGKKNGEANFNQINIQSVPESYILPVEIRPGELVVAPLCNTIQVIDLQKLSHHKQTELVHQILNANQEFRFFLVCISQILSVQFN
ncbi:hypothetical protein ACSBR2_032124 [Camellia fascicularis]